MSPCDGGVLVLLGGRRTAQAATAKPSALDELLSTEKDIAAQMAAAAREAGELTAAARHDTEAQEREAEAALAAELAALDKRDGDARAELIRQLEDEGARLVASYGALSPADLERHAAFVVSEITGLPLEQGR
ncbi:MAG TPA: hypothetical protein VF368_03260 [Gemmatimonadaceae bacterium]